MSMSQLLRRARWGANIATVTWIIALFIFFELFNALQVRVETGGDVEILSSLKSSETGFILMTSALAFLILEVARAVKKSGNKSLAQRILSKTK